MQLSARHPYLDLSAAILSSHCSKQELEQEGAVCPTCVIMTPTRAPAFGIRALLAPLGALSTSPKPYLNFMRFRCPRLGSFGGQRWKHSLIMHILSHMSVRETQVHLGGGLITTKMMRDARNVVPRGFMRSAQEAWCLRSETSIMNCYTINSVWWVLCINSPRTHAHDQAQRTR